MKEFDLLREENARLITKITELEFEKAELEARNAELRERVAKFEEKQLQNVLIKKLIICIAKNVIRTLYL